MPVAAACFSATPSPMAALQVDIEGQRSKEEQPSVGYPDICFAIEDFDDAFKGLVSLFPSTSDISAPAKQRSCSDPDFRG